MSSQIAAVAFDCFGTLIDFGDEAFAQAYGVICAEQGIAVDGQAFYDKWMEVWRRLAQGGRSPTYPNQPLALSEAEAIPPHPEHHTPSAGRSRSVDGPLPDFRPYRDEWPEHFAICFEELGVRGDSRRAHERLVELICDADAFPESRRTVEALRDRVPLALLSNADDDFLLPPLKRNGISFPVVVSSETAQAYKPHSQIFRTLVQHLDVPAQSVLYVGDSRLADVAGAKHAGLQVAWINRKPDAERKPIEVDASAGKLTFEPDYEIDSLERLLDIVSR